MRHVILGDGVAGHTAAETIREEDGDAAIDVFTTEAYPFYDRIGLRDYVRKGRDIDDLIIEDVDWYQEHDIDLHLETEIVDIDRDAKTVETAAGDTYDYDRLLLAVGGTPRTIPMEDGVDRLHHLWTIDGHGTQLRQHLEDADRGVVIGGGLLGFDLIGAFAATDTDTTYLIRESNWWPSVLDEDGASIIHDAMRAHGVDLQLEEEAQHIDQEHDTVTVETDRDTYEVGVVGMAIGHIRHLDLAEDAGLETNHGIVCDEYLQTDDEHIYVAGDVAEYHDPVLERRNLGGSWVTAQEQGEVAGKNMAGNETALDFVDTYTVNHFGVNVASLGDPRTTEGHDVITAKDEEAGTYRKLVLDDDRIIGAAVIGAMQWVYPLKQLIRGKVDVSAHRDDLEDPSFDLKQLV